MSDEALLLSGGHDSVALAWWRRPRVAITVDYGQLAADAEIEASARVCTELSIMHQVIRVDCRALGAGDLAGTAAHTLAPASDWWPYRNQLLITVSAMRAIAMGITTLLLGTVKSDHTHLDGTESFVTAISAVLELQEGRMSVAAPALTLTTAQLIRTAAVPMSVLAWAHSCHKANVACGVCRGCNKHFEVLSELGYGLD